MKKYQVLARRYRPQTFLEVIGQEPTVTTLKNAIKNERLAHAYLFSGPRGTGKTTLARIFSKALNCKSLSPDFEPCNACSSCREITNGTSLDVLEIDGASHRGIDDIRQINETVGYSTSSGGYKVYIIDEVHMLTKEAFNALLKTLEEPPQNVKFFFATTEPHKVLPTILSRCQRFNLNRITTEQITKKLKEILDDLGHEAEEEALRLIAMRAEGGLRDAESILDQLLSFHDGKLTQEIVSSALGVVSRDSLFALDKAGKEGHLAAAFDIAAAIYLQGKDIPHFIEMLIDHMRTLLLVKIGGKEASYLSLTATERTAYAASAESYGQEQCMNLIDYLVEMHTQIRLMPSGRIALEAILLHILRSHRRIPIEVLVRRLVELEQAVMRGPSSPAGTTIGTPAPAIAVATPSSPPTPASYVVTTPVAPSAAPVIPDRPAPIAVAPVVQAPIAPTPQPQQQKVDPRPVPPSSITIDPTPKDSEIVAVRPVAQTKTAPKATSAPTPTSPPTTPILPVIQAQYDTLMQFAAVELEGRVQKVQQRPQKN